LTIIGEDEKNNKYEKIITFDLAVEKEKHELKFTRAELQPKTLTCKGTAYLDVSLVNLGKDKEDVTLEITSSELSINKKEEFTLDDDPFDDESEFKKKFVLVIDETSQGIYPIQLKAVYGGDDIQETINMEVRSCAEEEVIGEDEEDMIIANDIKENVIVNPSVQTKKQEYDYLEQYGTAIVVGIIMMIVLIASVTTIIITKRK
ncbi:MAG: hypothetical protein ABIJ08_04525, partial [Nanoarchaeota archaeon]